MAAVAGSDAQVIKIVLLGGPGVGKSAITQRFIFNVWDAAIDPTVGASFLAKDVVYEGRAVKIHLWDTAGQEKYKALAPMFYRAADACLLVFDLTRADSLKELDYWVTQLRENGPPGVVLSVLANKSDVPAKREVDEATGAKRAASYGASYHEVSAKTKKGIEEAFVEAVKRVPRPAAGGGGGGSEARGVVELREDPSSTRRKSDCPC